VSFVFMNLPSADLDGAALRKLTPRAGSPRNRAKCSILRRSGAQLM
jgi:hypothetical protein